ncbi:unnamed protein product [Rotaria sp. Silwood2]|nr:unnamed protein product [Rotaria sp. Silwood2]CAF3040640.1 unnamed protein product [Rotaria sp. Silwood2]CAF3247987.1 unnamed protein product [Rotaria sp. Silwood2]CAF3376898.1 unnamed protein product [Rotaria sp. Silwood2]CAF4053886.1 unnamed protein product [Rotaria sp. Silwood2]
MGFFLSDLHQQIEHLSNQQPITEIPFTVYRGQGMSIYEFEKLRQSIGGLLSFNNFLSTSMNKDVSLMFCPTSYSDPDIIPILYEMEIDPTQKSTAFASLTNMSQFDSEEEILFSMHAVF